MTEEELEYTVNYDEASEELQEEYYEEEEGGEGEWDGDEEDAVQVGDDIELTHEEVWDDTALIEAWDAAVKQYEVYHSKSTKEVISKSNTTTTTQQPANTGTTLLAPSSKRARSEISNEENATIPPTIPDQTKAKETEKKAEFSSSAEYTASDRKPSFKKADKPAFSHYKEHKEQQQNDKKRVKFDTPKPPKKPLSSTPPIDAATIAFYQQMGYYYDPEYTSQSSTADSEQTGPSEASTKSTSTKPKGSTSTTTQPTHQQMFTPFPHPHNPYMYPGYPPYSQGYPNPIPHFPQGPGMPHPMGGVGMGPSSGAIPGFPNLPPMPPMPNSGTSGSDDDTLSNLMMAWYFSGYYTGLYQAQRQRRQ
ncbi:hypothetical protein BGZ59_010341 [Podila verticillata]|nr:hypothetical protein BGZ59_010341 [Podila verticillata]